MGSKPWPRELFWDTLTSAVCSHQTNRSQPAGPGISLPLVYDPAALRGRPESGVCLGFLKPGLGGVGTGPYHVLTINGAVVSGLGQGILNQREIKIKQT